MSPRGSDGMRRALLLGLAVALLLGPATAGAWDAAALARLTSTKNCPGCDLSWADLRGAALSGAALSGATLTGAHLYKADLSRAYLSGANLSWRSSIGTDRYRPGGEPTGANLTGATLSRAYLEWAIWTDGRKCKPPSIGECIR